MFTISVGMPGPFELMIILAIVLILFGAGKLPKVLGQMGKGVKAFKQGVRDTNNTPTIEAKPTEIQNVEEVEEYRIFAKELQDK